MPKYIKFTVNTSKIEVCIGFGEGGYHIYVYRLDPASGRNCTFERNDGLRWFEDISETLCNSLMFAAVLEQFCYRMSHVISTVTRRIFLCFVCSNMDIASA